jgi:drug/metabolite transporter (DMT)-like permease
LGDLLVVASCVAASAGYVSGGRLSRTLGTWPTTLWGIAIGGVLLLPALPFAFGGVPWAAVGAGAWLAIGYLALVSSLLAYVTWYWALGVGGIGRVGTWQFAMPIISLGLAVVILAEPLSWPLAGAAAVILAGIWIAGR